MLKEALLRVTMYRLLVSVTLFGLAAVVCNPQGWPFVPNGNAGNGNTATVGNFPWGNNGGAASSATPSATWPTWQSSGSNVFNNNALRACGNEGGISGWPFQGDTSRSRHGNSVEICTSEIARLLIAAGQKMEQFCTAHSDRALREVYGVEYFKLRVRLSEFTDDNIQVRVRQRLVSIYARSCSDEYAALRILPDVVDAHRAVWRFERGTLIVLFPYNITPDTPLQSRCGREVDEGLIVVPKSAIGTVFSPDSDVSFGDRNLKRAIRHYVQELLHEGNINNSSKKCIDDDPW